MADFTFGTGEELQFTTQDTDLTHSWDFGDGTTSTEPSPTHLYSILGIYTVTHSSKDFCDVCTAVSHTIEITQASITVRSILLDTYTAKVGDIVTVTVIAQNLSSAYGTGTIVLKFDNEVIDTFNVTLDIGQEVTFNRQKQVTKAGTIPINICADNVCTVLFVESQVSVKSITLDSNISTGQPITTTIEVQNVGTFTEDKEIKTTLTNAQTAIFDTRTLTVTPGEIQTYNVIIDVTALPNGVYTVCAENVCRALSVAKSVVTTGSLAISSIPTGAEIFVDGESKGQFTNATVTGIPAGNHTFKLELSGYNDVTSTEPVVITGGMTTYIHTVLSPLEPTTGSISISTITPAHADIYIDGATTSITTTPATISGLSPGSHNIVLKMSGYENFSYTINVTVGQTSYLLASMMESPKLVGSINFTSIPDGAEIWLENKTTGLVEFTERYTPDTVPDIPIETYTFTLKSSGRMDTTGTITVVGGVTSYVYAVLPLVSATVGSLVISSVPQGADIYIDGYKQLDINGQPIVTPTTIELSPKIGYNVTLKKAGYNDFSTTVDIITGQASYVGVTLSPLVLVITAAAFPWWSILGLAVGMYYMGKEKKEEEIKIPPHKKPQELLATSIPTKLREKGAVGNPICTGETCKIGKWMAVAEPEGQEPIIIHDP